ncbi:MAG: NADH dehydrogenase (quinone) subunit G, partial [Nitrospirae bacterium]
FLTETGRLAHVVLPACTAAEKDGTFTNLEGRVLRIRQSMDPIGDSLPDWHIMTAIAGGLGAQWEYESSADIQTEIMKLLPGYYNLGQPRKLAPTAEAYLANGYAAEVGSRYASIVNRQSSIKGSQFVLLMGQVLAHSGKLSTQALGLMQITPNTGRLRMSRQDIERLGLAEGAKVRVASALGSLTVGVQVDLAVMPGSCFFPEHFNEPPVKDLMPVEVDAATGVPAFKLTSVTIDKV